MAFLFRPVRLGEAGIAHVGRGEEEAQRDSVKIFAEEKDEALPLNSVITSAAALPMKAPLTVASFSKVKTVVINLTGQ